MAPRPLFLLILYPQNLSHRELLILHAEIKALQYQYGLSYKDATHRLYETEAKTISLHDYTYECLWDMNERMDTVIVDDITKKIKDIDLGVAQNAGETSQHDLDL